MLGRLKKHISTKNRKHKFNMAELLIGADDAIIDIGVAANEYGNEDVNFFEKCIDGNKKIVCLGLPDDYTDFKAAYPNAELIIFDGINFPKFDNKFDFAFSNAVIEHVGDYETQIEWLSGIKKITKRIFITTPNRLCPFEAHTSTFLFHWFPNIIRDLLYRTTRQKYGGYFWLMSGRKFKKALREAGFKIERVIKNKFLFFTIDYVIIASS